MVRFVRRRWRRAQKWVTAQRKAYTDGRRRRARERREQAEERSHMELERQAYLDAAAKAALSQLDAEFLARLKQEIRTQLLAECQGEALERAQAGLDETLEKRREALEDRYARLKADAEQDALEQADRTIERQREELLQEFRDRTEDLRAQRTEWKSRAEVAEGMLADWLQQLCGGTDNRVYLRSGGRGLASLDKGPVNAILARAGLQLRSRQTYSERLVAVRLSPDKVEGHSLFWLTTTVPAGVSVEPDGDEAAAEPMAEGSGSI